MFFIILFSFLRQITVILCKGQSKFDSQFKWQRNLNRSNTNSKHVFNTIFPLPDKVIGFHSLLSFNTCRCNIPVIVMGETGCGKTRLIRYMCGLQAGPEGPRNMLLVKVS